MALPIKKKTKAIDKRIDKALEIAGENEEKKPGKPSKVGDSAKKKVGRPPLAGERKGKLFSQLTQETADRFKLAFLNEKLKRAKRGEEVDQSLLVEIILKEWMDKNKY